MHSDGHLHRAPDGTGADENANQRSGSRKRYQPAEKSGSTARTVLAPLGVPLRPTVQAIRLPRPLGLSRAEEVPARTRFVEQADGGREINYQVGVVGYLSYPTGSARRRLGQSMMVRGA